MFTVMLNYSIGLIDPIINEYTGQSSPGGQPSDLRYFRPVSETQKFAVSRSLTVGDLSPVLASPSNWPVCVYFFGIMSTVMLNY